MKSKERCELHRLTKVKCILTPQESSISMQGCRSLPLGVQCLGMSCTEFFLSLVRHEATKQARIDQLSPLLHKIRPHYGMQVIAHGSHGSIRFIVSLRLLLRLLISIVLSALSRKERWGFTTTFPPLPSP